MKTKLKDYWHYNEEIYIHEGFVRFVEDDLAPQAQISKKTFWDGLKRLAIKFSKENERILLRRKELQNQINTWYFNNRSSIRDIQKYKKFLKNIGYLIDQGANFRIDTTNIDDEISEKPAPQLVVPVDNARFAINAANARWGSLYDALYSTDVIGSVAQSTDFDHERANQVISWTKSLLDEVLPIRSHSWSDLTAIKIENHELHLYDNLGEVFLESKDLYQGYNLNEKLLEILFCHNNLGIIVTVNKSSKIGKLDQLGISDVVLESAVTTIMDLEDSVATVGVNEKILAYKNWLTLMTGEITSSFKKNGKNFTRSLKMDRFFISPMGKSFEVRNRSLMFVRNVGHHIMTPIVKLNDGSEIGEGLLDALVTTACSLADLRKKGGIKNSLRGSIYVVKPKMHGPDEVTFTNDIFKEVEDILNIPRNTVKIGLMDEERRTSLNLEECIRRIKSRVVFINTGFLDRTGDEIFTSTLVGPMIKRNEMKSADWLQAYEKNNVDVGLKCGLIGRAQIGKGMWAATEQMSNMFVKKIGHIHSGASCSWVPSPVAATLHAVHYHRADVRQIQKKIAQSPESTETHKNQLLKIPALGGTNLSKEEILGELENNAQGILGYVVRWINQGVGCSKVLDIYDVYLMEDRATCRIASQYLANWFHHGLISRQEILDAFEKMALKVDKQNEGAMGYNKLSTNPRTPAFLAALELVFEGQNQSCGYIEETMFKYRRQILSGIVES